MVCFIKSETDVVIRDTVLTHQDMLKIQAYLKTQPLIGNGTPDCPEFDSIVCTTGYIKTAIVQICNDFGLKYQYSRFRLDPKSKNLNYAFKHIKLNPQIFGDKCAHLNDETNTSEDNDNY